ncbi:MAG TPA: guanylate kinase [Ktedonobacterales bacterium]|nr:guanylate kinase [Ktedonobacterales bacterium]
MTSQQEVTPGLLFVLSAPSGTGKDTVIRRLREQGLPIRVAVTVTTRAPRPGEIDGVHYYFVSPDAYQRMLTNDELLEHAEVHGNWYGVPRRPVREWLAAGEDVLLKIDVQGAATVRQKVPQAIFIFLAPQSISELNRRLSARHSETETERARRLADASYELTQQTWYDYRVVNRQGHLDEAVEKVKAIITAEHCRVHPRVAQV